MSNRMFLWGLLSICLIFANASASEPNLVLVEAESFQSWGGWVNDQQFMDLMGSPFLLAHGMGQPVDDAQTKVNVSSGGTYRVWVRTRDWVAPWKVEGAPGKFQLLIDGQPLKTIFGTKGDPWHWQDGGTVEVAAGDVSLALHDLTGFDGRCDAIVFCDDLDWSPPNERDALAEFRRKTLGLSAEPKDVGEFDLVVIGGGTAGCSAAVTAARLGLKVALVQDRPVLGGNSSSEVRVWPEGHVNQHPYRRVGDVVMELVPPKRGDSKNAQSATVFDDERKLSLVKSEPNISLYLENRMNDAKADRGLVKSVVCQHVKSGERIQIRGRMFLDSTGDGSLGDLVGADFEQTDKGHMGASNLWNIKCLCEDEDPLSSELASACEDASFPRCPWAVDLTDKPFPGREDGPTDAKGDPNGNPISLGNWFWESGFDRDPINEMERVRDQNLRAAYGAWDVIKNVEKRYPAHRLNWVAYIAGKRESRRLMGDVILTGEDLRDGKVFEDGCFPCTWGIDTHFPHEKYKDGHAGDEFISDYTRGKGYDYKGPYWVPYRCLYSRNIKNLFMAGRNISTTHEALGAVRVMKTTGTMGEIVGMAAYVCTKHGCFPRGVYEDHLDDLKQAMTLGAGKPDLQPAAEDGAFQLSARAATVRGKWDFRYEKDSDCIGYWQNEGDTVEWVIAIPESGSYRPSIKYSCSEEDAGGEYLVELGEKHEVKGKVESSGDWEKFRDDTMKPVELAVGTHRISIVNKKKKGALMKLRSFSLVPVE